MQYQAPKLKPAPVVDARWDKSPWSAVSALAVDQPAGDSPDHFPRVLAKLGYDAEAVYAIFRVEDRYVRAVARRHQDGVCKDSCVEFFFVPGEDLANGYFNVEMNCGGIMLFHFQKQPRKDPVRIAPKDLAQMTIAHSLPTRVEPELQENVTWTVEYRLPFGMLSRYRTIVRPAPGAVWRANFYKCGDKTSHPHWLAWAPVRSARPDFHVPGSFGEVKFA